jgi:hypothetical protein
LIKTLKKYKDAIVSSGGELPEKKASRAGILKKYGG